jgi:excisionase family DNA binding protein
MDTDPRSNTPKNGAAAPQPASADEFSALLTVDDVAALLKVSRSWVYEHIRSRGIPRSERLPHIKVGKYIRFDPRALRRFIADKCRTT